jgi:hypothetical protein
VRIPPDELVAIAARENDEEKIAKALQVARKARSSVVEKIA